MSGRTLGICAGLGAAVFVSYCFYFDQKRRSAPDFRKKLKEKRRLAAENAKKSNCPALPDLSDQEAVQRFFLQEVQLGEELLGQGDVANGIEHLSLAVAVCGQPQSLLSVLQQSLPDPIYKLLLTNIDNARNMVRAHAIGSMGLESKSAMKDDELE